MPRSVVQSSPTEEVKSPHRGHGPSDEAVKKLHQMTSRPLAMAKAKLGAAFAHAIGDQARKAYGHEGLMSGVCSGEKMPDYMARMYLDPDARLRFALELLKGNPKVRVRPHWTIDIEEG